MPHLPSTAGLAAFCECLRNITVTAAAALLIFAVIGLFRLK